MQLITISGIVMEDESRHSRNGFDFQFFKVCCHETRSDGKLLNEKNETIYECYFMYEKDLPDLTQVKKGMRIFLTGNLEVEKINGKENNEWKLNILVDNYTVE